MCLREKEEEEGRKVIAYADDLAVIVSKNYI